MDRSRLLPRVCFYTAVGLAALGVLLRTIAYLTCFDIQIGYFDPGLIPTLSNILFGVAVAAAAALAILTPKGAVATALHTPTHKIPALIMGTFLAAFTIVAFILCYPLKKGDLLLAPVILGLLGSTYYFVSAFAAPTREDHRYPDWLSALGFLPILWSLAALAETYTDRYVAMNSPTKLSIHLALIGYLLITMTELRYRLGKPVPRLALFGLSVGVVFTLSGSLPILIATGAKVLADVPHTLYAAVLLIAGLYGAYLFFCLIKTAPTTANATVAEPCETAAKPEA